jgi:hypothetical protein
MMDVSKRFLGDCAQMAAEIDSARRDIAREMREFPTPFPACDVHFTRLSEERSRLQRMATALEAFSAAAHLEASPLIHPRDTVYLPDGTKQYHPAPASNC